MRNLYAWIALPLLLAAEPAGATTQIPDEIVIEGRTMALLTKPFVEYLVANKNDMPKLKAYVRQTCSAAWMGFKARWEIVGQTLLLAALFADPCDRHPTSIPLTEFFPELTGPVPATWFTGKLVVGQGDRTGKGYPGNWQPGYERYLVISIERGLVAGTEETASPPDGRQH